MKRPQTAKPGYRAPICQNSIDDVREKECFHKDLHCQHVKLIQPDFSINDFSKIMPKKIQQDKQRLYSQSLQLKQKMNEIVQENIRLKTKISIMERERDKLLKMIDKNGESRNKSDSRSKMYQAAVTTEKQSSMLVNYKKKIHESQEENQYLKQQNNKIKKIIKYTKIKQVEIQCKILREEYFKLQQRLTEMSEQLQEKHKFQKQARQFKKYLDEEIQANKQLKQQNKKRKEYVESIQEKIKIETEKITEKEKKFQRDLGLQKRKLSDEIKINDDLKKQIKTLKQAPQNTDTKTTTPKLKPIIRPILYNPYGKETKQQSSNKQTQKNIQFLKIENKKLGDQLKQLKHKLSRIQKQQQKNNIFQQNKKKDNCDEKNFQKEEKIKQIKQNDEYQQIEEAFIEKYVEEKQSHSNYYQPNKEIIQQLEELLTYRMIAQQYPFEKLQKNLLKQSQQICFTYENTQSMFKALPFNLNSLHRKAFLEYLFQKPQIKLDQIVKTEVLIKKLRKVIKDFKVEDKKEREEKYQKIISMTCKHHNDLKEAFNKIKNGPDTIAMKDLAEMFHELGLADQYIEIIVFELSLCSQDLQHLSIKGYFQKFYLLNVSDQAIDNHQFEIEQKNKGQSNNKNNQVDEQIEEDFDQVHFIMDQCQLSMKGKQHNSNNFQFSKIISDDGHI